MVENKYYKAVYNFVPVCKNKLFEMDEGLRKTDRDFKTILAYASRPTGLKTNGGRDIKFSYIPWHNAFLQSTDNEDADYFRDLCCQTGAMAFIMFNKTKDEYDYIVALNSDVYERVCYPLYRLTLAHEMGHAICDHAFVENHDKRSIDRELEADDNGFKLISSYFKDDKNIFTPDMISSKSFTFKHILAGASMAFGEKGLSLIMKEYGKKDHFELCKEISSYMLNLDPDLTKIEDGVRSKNFEEWLKAS